jgi:hypothetical protein
MPRASRMGAGNIKTKKGTSTPEVMPTDAPKPAKARASAIRT